MLLAHLLLTCRNFCFDILTSFRHINSFVIKIFDPSCHIRFSFTRECHSKMSNTSITIDKAKENTLSGKHSYLILLRNKTSFVI